MYFSLVYETPFHLPKFKNLIEPASLGYVANFGKYVRLSKLQAAKYASPNFESELNRLLVEIQLTESNQNSIKYKEYYSSKNQLFYYQFIIN